MSEREHSWRGTLPIFLMNLRRFLSSQFVFRSPHSLYTYFLLNPLHLSTMSSKQDWEQLFKDDKFVDKYKTAERLTGQFAQALISQSGLLADSITNPGKPLVVFDNACGTGVVSSILNQQLHDTAKGNWKLTCGDISEGMLEYTRRRMERENWQNAEVKTLDAQALDLPSGHFTHVITAFGKISKPSTRGLGLLLTRQ